MRLNKIVMDSGGMMQAEPGLRIVGHQTSLESYQMEVFTGMNLSTLIFQQVFPGKRFTRSQTEKRNVTPASVSISRTLPATRE